MKRNAQPPPDGGPLSRQDIFIVAVRAEIKDAIAPVLSRLAHAEGRIAALMEQDAALCVDLETEEGRVQVLIDHLREDVHPLAVADGASDPTEDLTHKLSQLRDALERRLAAFVAGRREDIRVRSLPRKPLISDAQGRIVVSAAVDKTKERTEVTLVVDRGLPLGHLDGERFVEKEAGDAIGAAKRRVDDELAVLQAEAMERKDEVEPGGRS